MECLAVSAAKFLGRCCLFSMLWTLTQFLLVYSLRVLGCTEVMALFATNVSFIYLLSWVVLHEHFVGIRVSRSFCFYLKLNCLMLLYAYNAVECPLIP